MYVCWFCIIQWSFFTYLKNLGGKTSLQEPMGGSFEATHDRIRESCWKKNETGCFFLFLLLSSAY